MAEFLRGRFAAAVLAPALDPTAGIDKRSGSSRSYSGGPAAGQLQAGEPVHLLAHSMGGLDARLLIRRNPVFDESGKRGVIRTLATISTPHRGSPIADLVALKFLEKIPFLAPVLKEAESALGKVLDHFRISLDGLHDLTSESAEHFNSENPDDPSVKYLSFAGAGRPGPVPTSRFFRPYYEFLKAHSRGREDSDGVVPVPSAKWGIFDPNLWPGDHADEIGHDLDRPLGKRTQETLQRFEKIVLQF